MFAELSRIFTKRRPRGLRRARTRAFNRRACKAACAGVEREKILHAPAEDRGVIKGLKEAKGDGARVPHREIEAERIALKTRTISAREVDLRELTALNPGDRFSDCFEMKLRRLLFEVAHLAFYRPEVFIASATAAFKRRFKRLFKGVERLFIFTDERRRCGRITPRLIQLKERPIAGKTRTREAQWVRHFAFIKSAKGEEADIARKLALAPAVEELFEQLARFGGAFCLAHA